MNPFASYPNSRSRSRHLAAQNYIFSRTPLSEASRRRPCSSYGGSLLRDDLQLDVADEKGPLAALVEADAHLSQRSVAADLDDAAQPVTLVVDQEPLAVVTLLALDFPLP